ncbi:MAG: septum formation inhibitor [Bacteroidales bacterium]|nr:septum formation inhibitor [Bacteroidales bacterium]MCF8405897.1 septum formation inhibitor [Bacteroidales bacterium]
MIKKIPPYLKNKYSVALIVFFIWILFFDRNSMINQYRLVSTLNEMEDQREYYQTELYNDSIALHILQSNKDKLERYAREKYLMKRDNEDIYLILENKE